MSDAQLKRKRSQREKAPDSVQSKRQKNEDLSELQNGTPTKADIANDDTDKSLQLVAADGKKSRTRRGRRTHGNRVAVQNAQVVDHPVTTVPPKKLWHLSRPVGGRLMSHDPVFSQDERYRLLYPPSDQAPS